MISQTRSQVDTEAQTSNHMDMKPKAEAKPESMLRKWPSLSTGADARKLIMQVTGLWLSTGIICFACLCGVPTDLPAATNYVTSTSPTGPGSLYQAISDANAAGEATILFSNVTGRI